MTDKIYVNEIFTSVSGEQGLFRQGDIVCFVRLSGCNLKCNYCDSAHTQIQKDAEMNSIQEIAKHILDQNCDKIVITGGEPLLQQEELSILITILKEIKPYCSIQIETNGTIIPIPSLSMLVDFWVVDLKLHELNNSSMYSLSVINKWISWTGFSNSLFKIVVQTVSEIKLAFAVVDFLSSNNISSVLPSFSLSPCILHKTKNDVSRYVNTIIKMQQQNIQKVSINIQLHKFIGMK